MFRLGIFNSCKKRHTQPLDATTHTEEKSFSKQVKSQKYSAAMFQEAKAPSENSKESFLNAEEAVFKYYNKKYNEVFKCVCLIITNDKLMRDIKLMQITTKFFIIALLFETFNTNKDLHFFTKILFLLFIYISSVFNTSHSESAIQKDITAKSYLKIVDELKKISKDETDEIEVQVSPRIMALHIRDLGAYITKLNIQLDSNATLKQLYTAIYHIHAKIIINFNTLLLAHIPIVQLINIILGYIDDKYMFKQVLVEAEAKRGYLDAVIASEIILFGEHEILSDNRLSLTYRR